MPGLWFFIQSNSVMFTSFKHGVNNFYDFIIVIIIGKEKDFGYFCCSFSRCIHLILRENEKKERDRGYLWKLGVVVVVVV